MRRYLVVANRTLGTEALQHELLLRAETEPSSFYFLVPHSARTQNLSAWPGPGGAAASQDSHQDTWQRLRQVLTEIRGTGAVAAGEVTEDDPVHATKRRMQLKNYDEIIVSTLPTKLSQWLRMDLPSRLQRAVAIPVITMTAKDED